MPIHTGSAWEEDNVIYLDSSRVHDNAFPFFPPDDGRMPSPETKADYVRWTIDLAKPAETVLPDPQVLLDIPCEFPRIDERFLGSHTHITFVDCFVPQHTDASKNVFQGLNGLGMYDDRTKEAKYWFAGEESLVQEPIFIPRSDDAKEGGGYHAPNEQERRN